MQKNDRNYLPPYGRKIIQLVSIKTNIGQKRGRGKMYTVLLTGYVSRGYHMVLELVSGGHQGVPFPASAR